jgi:hypothetical protein
MNQPSHESTLTLLGWTPIALQLAQHYGQIIVEDCAEEAFYHEWSNKLCDHLVYDPNCDICAAKDWLK